MQASRRGVYHKMLAWAAQGGPGLGFWLAFSWASGLRGGLRAQEPAPVATQVDLVWEAPSGCPDRAAFGAELEHLTGRALTASGRRVLLVHARVTGPSDAGYALDMSTRIDDDRGTRRLSAASCAELTHAAALVVALGIDANETVPLPPTAAAARAPQSEAAAVPTPARPQTRALAAHVRAAAALDLGSLPGSAGGVEIAGGLQLRALQLELAALALPGARAHLGSVKNAGAELHVLRVGAQVCYALLPRTRLLAVCARADYGRVWGNSFGIASTASGGGPWLSLGGGARSQLPLFGPLDLVLDLGVSRRVSGSASITARPAARSPVSASARQIAGDRRSARSS